MTTYTVTRSFQSQTLANQMLTNQAGWIIGSLCTNPIPIKPAIVLPVPRSDNQRKTLTPGGQLLTAGWVKSYRKAVGIMVKKVPETPCIVLYRVFFARRGIDASNVIKTLLDAIFGQDGDSEAYPWCLPPAIDKANPRVEVWFVSL